MPKHGQKNQQSRPKPKTEPKSRYLFRRMERLGFPRFPTAKEIENDDLEGYEKRVMFPFLEQQKRETDPVYLIEVLKDRVLIEIKDQNPDFPDKFSEKDLYGLFKRKDNESLEDFQDKDYERLDSAVNTMLALLKAEILLRDANESAKELAVQLLRTAHGFGDSILLHFEPTIWQGSKTKIGHDRAKEAKKANLDKRNREIAAFYRRLKGEKVYYDEIYSKLVPWTEEDLLLKCQGEFRLSSRQIDRVLKKMGCK